jgi:hypothetical protein
VLRWGLGLTLNLIARLPRDPFFDLWSRTLLAVEVGLSPTSTWTAQTAPDELTLDKPFGVQSAESAYAAKFPWLVRPVSGRDTEKQTPAPVQAT